jgi:hypothetical protein
MTEKMISETEARLDTHEEKGPVSFIGKAFTKELVEQYLKYDPIAGSYTRVKTSGNKLAGTSVGCVAGKYLQLNCCGKKLRGHQVAWFLTYGYIPKCIDHINGNGLDNRICNLREVTQQQNVQNVHRAPSHNGSGYLGVSYFKAMKKFSAYVTNNYKKIHLGYFDDPAMAHQAYLTEKRKLHASCTI